MYVISVTSVSEYDQASYRTLNAYAWLYTILHYNSFKDYTIDAYFRQYWNDERLAFDPADLGRSDNYSKLIVRRDVEDTFWVPDTVIVNEKETEYHEATVKSEFFRINSDGEVLRSIRYL